MTMCTLSDQLTQVLWSSTKGECLATSFDFLYKPKVSNLDVSLQVDEQVLWLEISVDVTPVV